ncbi:hypothetical protein PHPI107946_03120 [Phocicoccus pinnipedialis]|uniref:Uncharacterized protein n=1 Tax=Phocicoccus pinnipedialis TaxID=110845 RepID=A0A6V7R5Q2_9BACL|nr:putative neutral ceramidase superfamily lipid hydrolase [Jeotgalicoccus pinnipedialis]CAD2072374.1 hypothetical protein JEOPIN946_00474 [Jeotgalicoccus pinnipedialis]
MRTVLYGFYSGLFLLAITYLMDSIFQKQLVTILLNVDFITNKQSDSLIFEWGLHLFVSIIIFIVFSYLKPYRWLYISIYVMSMFMFTFLYIQLPKLAVYENVTQDLFGLLLWLIAHVMYLVLVHYLIGRLFTRKNGNMKN